MSASARMYQYGAMRAIGTSIRQFSFMVEAETFTYLFYGLLTGLAAGLPFHRLLYRRQLPHAEVMYGGGGVSKFCTIAFVMTVSALAAIEGPVRRIRRMPVVETISAK
ncbi:ABC transporter permease [Clostridium sp. WCA-389-WT-23D1]|uniref:ABC transporter permease n=2 Tax=Clostridium TaxID=1485 RepID=A0A7X2NQD7_9CLOT|nr:FtsX-like permease family protein [Clostridium sp.]MSS38578.1 ABC transporter permease [Clostridium porci]